VIDGRRFVARNAAIGRGSSGEPTIGLLSAFHLLPDARREVAERV
jgi:hypothetical protein